LDFIQPLIHGTLTVGLMVGNCNSLLTPSNKVF
jgi:hypothetical protein